MGLLRITRIPRLMDRGRDYEIFLDEAPVATLASGDSAERTISDGEHRIRVATEGRAGSTYVFSSEEDVIELNCQPRIREGWLLGLPVLDLLGRWGIEVTAVGDVSIEVHEREPRLMLSRLGISRRRILSDLLFAAVAVGAFAIFLATR